MLIIALDIIVITIVITVMIILTVSIIMMIVMISIIVIDVSGWYLYHKQVPSTQRSMSIHRLWCCMYHVHYNC